MAAWLRCDLWEELLGAPAILNGGPSPSAAMVQAETDTCYRMPADVFREEIDRRNSFHEWMARYAQALTGVIMQSTACNALHSVEQRLARWLLLAHDPVGKNEFPLTTTAKIRAGSRTFLNTMNNGSRAPNVLAV